MPKRIPKQVEQTVFRIVAEAFRTQRKLSVDRLYEELRHDLGEPLPVGRTTIWKIQKNALTQIKPDLLPPDTSWNPSPVEWSPEAYPFLLALNRFCVTGVDRSRNSLIGGPESNQLTVREAGWGAKLYSALKDAPIDLAYHVVSMFVSRETVKEVYEQPIILDDLVGYLGFKPWESIQANETYELACRLGRVSRVRRIRKIDTMPAGEQSERSTGWDRDEQIGEIRASAIDGSAAYIKALLSTPEKRRWDELQKVVERAEMLKQAAMERIDAIWESKSGQAPSRPMNAKEADAT